MNQPPIGVQYNLWSQPPITRGQILNITPPMAILNINTGQQIWKQPLHQTQHSLFRQAPASPSTLNVEKNVQRMVPDTWGHANPLNQQAYQLIPQSSPQ